MGEDDRAFYIITVFRKRRVYAEVAWSEALVHTEAEEGGGRRDIILTFDISKISSFVDAVVLDSSKGFLFLAFAASVREAVVLERGSRLDR